MTNEAATNTSTKFSKTSPKFNINIRVGADVALEILATLDALKSVGLVKSVDVNRLLREFGGAVETGKKEALETTKQVMSWMAENK